MAKETKTYTLNRGCLDTLRPFLLAPAAYKDHPQAGALMVASYGIQENHVSRFAVSKTDGERAMVVECELSEHEQQAISCCVKFCLSNSLLIPHPDVGLLIEEFLAKKLETKDEKTIDFNVTLGGLHIIKQALTSLLVLSSGGERFCWYKDEGDKAMAVLKTVALLPKFPKDAPPKANDGETEDAYTERIKPFTDPDCTLSLTRSEADVVTSALKIWIKHGVLQINRHTVRLIKEFSL